MKIIKRLTKHKRRFDRGRIYYSYFNAIITALLVVVFSQGDLLNSIISAVAVFVLIYIFGFVDDISKIHNEELKQYSEKNPILMEILNKLNELTNETNN